MTNTNLVPTVHLNGTSRESLLEQREKVYRKLREAERALCEAYPHARDFYVKSDYPAVYDEARKQHQRRLAALGELMQEMIDEAEILQKEC